MRAGRRRALLLAALLTAGGLAGCGLPLGDGARPAGDVPGRTARAAGIKVLPPGPQRGATATELVRGFLGAQTSPDDNHAVARQFLLDPAGWDDDAFVVVFVPGSQRVEADPDRPDRVRLSLEPTALIAPDGSYRLATAAPAGQLPPVAQFRVARRPDGQLRLSQVPPGLRLQTGDLTRSFAPREVYFLGRATLGTATARLVPDRVFLPVTTDPARGLVEALLRGAAGDLTAAVQSAAPPGTRLRGLRVTDAGEVTVDLSEQVLVLEQRERMRLSAQLVWTLQDFPGVRLLAGGAPFRVDFTGDVQTVADWDEYDPAGVAPDASLYYVQDRRLRVLDAPAGAGEAADGAVAVDEAAVDLAETQVGVLTVRPGAAPDEVRIGPLAGQLGRPALQREGLGSLSWGSGDRGLWVLQDGPAPLVWVLPGAGSPPGARPSVVEVAAPSGAGRLSRLAVSRDGARVALVYGKGAARRLFVGLVEPTPTGLRLTAVTPVAPQLGDVTDVAWESGTSLVLLARDAVGSALLAQRVAVDGSGTAPLQRPGVDGAPLALAAAPGRRLVVSAALPGPPAAPPQLFRDDGQVFRRQAPGSLPTYPG